MTVGVCNGGCAEVLTRLDHVAIAVADLPRAITLFHQVLGLAFVGGGDNAELDIRVVQLCDDDGRKVELLTPLSDDSYLAGFIAKHGEGFHHITGYVADVEDSARRLSDAGVATVDTRTDRDTWHETFVRPASGFGALVQLARPKRPWSQPLVGVTVDDVLQGRVGVKANTAWWVDSGTPIYPADSES